jgi:hypothetical protein
LQLRKNLPVDLVHEADSSPLSVRRGRTWKHLPPQFA